ncbi:hypothetical protein LINGRAHAP2_LOCUS7944 [Linum grandiflorum]
MATGVAELTLADRSESEISLAEFVASHIRHRMGISDDMADMDEAAGQTPSKSPKTTGTDFDVDAEEDAASGPVRAVSPKAEEFPIDSDSTNKDLLEQTDKQISKIEAQAQLLTVLNNEEKPDDNLKLKQTKQLLVSIRGIQQQYRQRKRAPPNSEDDFTIYIDHNEKTIEIDCEGGTRDGVSYDVD